MSPFMKRPFVFFSCVLVVALVQLSFVRRAQAALVTSSEMIAAQDTAELRERVYQFLDSELVAQQMQTLGVSAQEARARVAAMNHAELSAFSQQIENLPAGQGAVEAIVGAAVLIFIILLITDLIGATNVFPFVRPV